MLLVRRPPAFHWRTLRESGGGREGIEGQPGARDGGGGAEGEDTKWAEEDKRLKDEGGEGVQYKQRLEGRLYSGGIHVGEIRGGSHIVTSGDTAGGKLQN